MLGGETFKPLNNLYVCSSLNECVSIFSWFELCHRNRINNLNPHLNMWMFFAQWRTKLSILFVLRSRNGFTSTTPNSESSSSDSGESSMNVFRNSSLNEPLSVHLSPTLICSLISPNSSESDSDAVVWVFVFSAVDGGNVNAPFFKSFNALLNGSMLSNGFRLNIRWIPRRRISVGTSGSSSPIGSGKSDGLFWYASFKSFPMSRAFVYKNTHTFIFSAVKIKDLRLPAYSVLWLFFSKCRNPAMANNFLTNAFPEIPEANYSRIKVNSYKLSVELQ